jgi:hypothetical protein
MMPPNAQANMVPEMKSVGDNNSVEYKALSDDDNDDNSSTAKINSHPDALAVDANVELTKDSLCNWRPDAQERLTKTKRICLQESGVPQPGH